MGYSADIQSMTNVLAIEAERIDAVHAALREASERMGHISWCKEFAAYEGTNRQVVAAILNDYGLDTTETESGAVVVSGWDGDKIGSSFDDVMAALAAGRTDTAPIVTWVWCGEDGDLWATRWTGDTYSQPAVTISVAE